MNIIKIKCPLCEKSYIAKPAVYNHILKEHPIPDNMPPDQYYYELTHPGKKKSTCIICHKPTTWNTSTHKYHRLCDRPECRKSIREAFMKNAMRKHNTYNYASDPEHQRKMLAGRHISGIYEFNDGGKVQYTGTYEKDFLAICDNILDILSKDICGPSPNQYSYIYEKETHFYIPDFFLPEYNLEVEIKEGGSNPNLHPKIQAVDKVKEKLKDGAIKARIGLNFVKIVDKNYTEFINVIQRLKTDNLTDKERRYGIKIFE